MINHFNFRRCQDKVLVTNDFGAYAFLSQDEFRLLVTGKVAPGSALFEVLEARGFVSAAAPEVFINERAGDIRVLKGYLFSATSLHIFVITNRCNQNCVYCQAKAPCSKLEGMMDESTGRKAIEVALQSPATNLTFEFQGGEPLLNFGVLQEMIEYSKSLNRDGRKNIEYTVVTNLVALTDDILAWLIENNVSICTSLDGGELVHNHNRKLRSGQGTYAAVKDAIARVRNAGRNVGAIETTTRFSLDYPREIVDEYVQSGFDRIFLRPLTPLGMAKANWAEVGYSPEEYLVFYRAAWEHILEINRQGIIFSEQQATIFLRRILSGQSVNYMDLRSPCGAGIGQMCYYCDGSVYTCDEGRMVGEAGDNAFCLGNVFTDTYDKLVGCKTCRATCAASVVETLPQCCDCVYQPYCGVCPVVAYASQGDIFPHGPNGFRCRVYKGILDVIFETLNGAVGGAQEFFHRWIGD